MREGGVRRREQNLVMEKPGLGGIEGYKLAYSWACPRMAVRQGQKKTMDVWLMAAKENI